MKNGNTVIRAMLCIMVLILVQLCAFTIAASAAENGFFGVYNMATQLTNYYDTLKEAFEAAEDGYKVVVEKDVTVTQTEQAVVASGRTITLDLNGHTIPAELSANTYGFIQVNGGLYVKRAISYSAGDGGGITVSGGKAGVFHLNAPKALLNIQGGTYQTDVKNDPPKDYVRYDDDDTNDDDVVADPVEYAAICATNSYVKISIENAEILSPKAHGILAAYVVSELKLTGTNITAESEYGAAIKTKDTVNLTINGGTIQGGTGIVFETEKKKKTYVIENATIKGTSTQYFGCGIRSVYKSIHDGKITNCTIVGRGSRKDNRNGSGIAITNANGGTLTISGSQVSSEVSNGILMTSIGTTLTVEDGSTITGNANTVDTAGISFDQTGSSGVSSELIVKNSTVKGYHGIVNRGNYSGAVFTIEDSAIEGITGDGFGTLTNAAGTTSACTVNVDGSTLTGKENGLYLVDFQQAKLKDSTFKGDTYSINATSTNEYEGELYFNGPVTTRADSLDCGWFTAQPADTLIKNGYAANSVTAVHDNVTYNYTIEYTGALTYYAEIEGGNRYPSLASAINAAQAGDTVLLLADVTEDTSVTITKDLTIKLQGHRVTKTSGNKASFVIGQSSGSSRCTVSIDGGSSGSTVESNYIALDVQKTGIVTTNNVNFTSTGTSAAVRNSGHIEMTGGTLEACTSNGTFHQNGTAGTCVLENVKIIGRPGDKAKGVYNNSKKTGSEDVLLKSCTIQVTSNQGGNGVCNYNSGTLTLENCNVTVSANGGYVGGPTVYNNSSSGTVNIIGGTFEGTRNFTGGQSAMVDNYGNINIVGATIKAKCNNDCATYALCNSSGTLNVYGGSNVDGSQCKGLAYSRNAYGTIYLEDGRYKGNVDLSSSATKANVIVSGGIYSENLSASGSDKVTVKDGFTWKANTDSSTSAAYPHMVTPNQTADTISISSSKEIYVDETVDLETDSGFMLSPSGAAELPKWSSADTSIATVSNRGVVTGVGAGEVVITAKIGNGQSATCRVTVKSRVNVLDSSDQIIGTYGALDKALANAPNDSTVELLMDLEGGPITVGNTPARRITVDFNGKTYTAGNDPNDVHPITAAFLLREGNTITFKNGTIKTPKASENHKISSLVENNANLTLTNMTLDGSNLVDSYGVLFTSTGKVTVDGSTSIKRADKATKYAIDVGTFGTSAKGTQVTIETTGEIVGQMRLVHDSGHLNSLEIKAGEFEGDIEVQHGMDDNLTISGGTFDLADNTMCTLEKLTGYCASGYTPFAVANQTDTYEVLQSVTVTFNANDGTTTPAKAQQIMKKGVETKLTKFDTNTFKKTAYHFGSWNDDPTGVSGNAYSDEQAVALDADVMLYVQWEPDAATAPTIDTQPSDLTLTYGYTEGSVSVAATADTGAAYKDLTYQWYINTTKSTENGTAITGATNASYAIETGKDAGTTEYYYCKVTATRQDNGASATATSAVATVTVDPASISEVSVAIDAPEATKALDTEATSTADVTLGAVAWDPNDTTAAYATEYTATVTATAAANYVFADDATATVNGKTATVAKNQDGTLSITYAFGKTVLEPVSITATNKTVTYSTDAIGIPMEGMFAIQAEAGAPSYTVTNGTGTGSFAEGKLTVTKCGTFTVQVDTAATDTHAAGQASATLTVEPAAISEVAVAIDTPAVGAALDTEATTATANVTLGAVAWDPNDTTAAYATEYTATVKATAAANYVFADDATATVNGEKATVAKNQDGTLNISYAFGKTVLEPVAITATDKTVTYSADGIAIPVEGMFAIPAEAGAPSYAVTNGTGTGSFSEGKLTVTKCGTFTVQVNTAETNTHAAGQASATLTVEPAAISEVAVAIDTPAVGAALDTEATTATANVTLGAVAWDPDDTTATYATAYTATVTATAAANYVFADDATATVNGEKATVAKNQDGTLNISYAFGKTVLEPVVITATDKTVTYSADGIAIPVEGMFAIPAEAGAATYTVSNGTGTGSFANGKLTVTKCGTFTVQVNTAATDTHAAGQASATLTVNPASSAAATVTANNRNYDGTEKPLVTVDESTLVGGTMYYALGTDAATAPEASAYKTSIPAGTEPGIYYVWYKAVGDANHSDTEAACVSARILAPISAKVTFKVVNGSWDDGTTEDKTVTLTGYEGDTLKLAEKDIPAVGNKPAKDYEAGSWDVMPDTQTAITQDTTYTYKYAEKTQATVVEAPTAIKPTYSGKALELVTAGVAEGGTMVYAVTKDTTAPEASAYTESIPKGTNAGVYYVWYKVVGDKDHLDSEPAKVRAKIRRLNINELKITIKDRAYTGKRVKPDVTIKHGKKTLVRKKDYILFFDPKIVKPGKYEVTAKGKGNYTGATTLEFMVVLPKVTIENLVSDTHLITVIWSEEEQMDGYQIQYCKRKDMSGKKMVTFKITDISPEGSKVIMGLSDGTRYYVRIRGYKIINKKKCFTAWSAIKSVKTLPENWQNEAARPVEMNVGETLDLKAALAEGEVAADWITNDTDIVAVTEEGFVTAMQTGKAAVTAILENGEEIQFAINVSENGIVLLEIGENDLTLDLDEDVLGDVFGDVETNFVIEEVEN